MAGGTVTPEAKGLFARLARIEPRDPRAAFYLGWADFQAGEHSRRPGPLAPAAGRRPADAPWRPQVIEGIQAAAQQLGIDPGHGGWPSARGRTAAPVAAPQPSAEDMATARPWRPRTGMAMIRGMVEKLQARMDADGSDVEGWLRLAQSRSVLGEGDRARATYEQALAQHPDEPALLKGYGQLLVGPAQRRHRACPRSATGPTSSSPRPRACSPTIPRSGGSWASAPCRTAARTRPGPPGRRCWPASTRRSPVPGHQEPHRRARQLRGGPP